MARDVGLITGQEAFFGHRDTPLLAEPGEHLTACLHKVVKLFSELAMIKSRECADSDVVPHSCRIKHFSRERHSEIGMEPSSHV